MSSRATAGDIAVAAGDTPPGAIGRRLQERADTIARRCVSSGFDDLLPPAGAMPGGFQALPALRGAWRRAWIQGAMEALELAAQTRDAILDLRTAELRQAPFATAVYEAAAERLAQVGSALPPGDLDAVLDRRVSRRLERAARRLERASRRSRLLPPGWDVGRARARILRRLRPLRGQLEDVLGRHLAALAAEALDGRLRGWRENVEASRARAAELQAGDDGRLRHVLAAMPGPAPWGAFGAWLAERGWLAPDLGPAAMEEALHAFVDELAPPPRSPSPSHRWGGAVRSAARSVRGLPDGSPYRRR